MGTGIWLAIFASQFLWVGLRSFQQRNVAFDNYIAVLPTSMCMASVEVYIIYSIARSGWSVAIVLAMAAGGGLGCLAAMWTHKKWLTNTDRSSKS